MRAALAALALLLSGCLTSEVIPQPLVRETDEQGNVTWRSTRHLRSVAYDPDYESYTESDLREATEERPEDPKAWWQLGDFYERAGRYHEALAAYQRLQELVEGIAAERGRHYVGGLYLVAKAQTLCGDYAQAVVNLARALEHEPSELSYAALNPTFRESHYLLGTIYYAHEEWALAEQHLRNYVRLSGDDARVAGMLARIERELHPERLFTRGGPRAP